MAFLRSLNQINVSKVSSVAPVAVCWRTLVVRCKHDSKVPDVNTVGQFHSSINQPQKGKIYSKKPFKFTAEKGRAYMWCSCGQSKTQPLCDGTHKSSFLKIKLRPVRFVVEETKEVWLCNCKQTNNRPFCDGTHRGEEVQSQGKS